MTGPGYLRGECLVLADPLLFMTATGEAIISPAIDRSARIRSPETFHQQAAAARTLPHTVHDEPAVILACAWDTAFYHFLYDVLGKLAVAELHGITPANHAVYFNAVHPWQIEALRLLGVVPRPLAGGIVHRFTRGVIPTYARVPWSRATPASVGLLRRLRVPAADSLPSRKFFVSRSSPGTARQLDNEAEIFARCFRPLGYDLVDPAILPFGEQCALFSTATHVAGPHGAGLSLFCLGRPPVALIELHSPHFHTDCFRGAAAAAGARYAAFNDRREGFKPPHWSANFTLDVDAVASWAASLPPAILSRESLEEQRLGHERHDRDQE